MEEIFSHLIREWSHEMKEHMSYEITGKRNLHYSRRHRIYGRDMTMMDFDSVEYDSFTKMPLAFIETKFGKVNFVDLKDPRLQVMVNTASCIKEGLPCFVLVYYPLNEYGLLMDANEDHSKLRHMQYYVIPANEKAKEFVPEKSKMSEIEWISVLKKIHSSKSFSNEVYYTEWWTVPLPNVFGE